MAEYGPQKRDEQGRPLTKTGEVDKRIHNGAEEVFPYCEETGIKIQEMREKGWPGWVIAMNLNMSTTTLYRVYNDDIRKSRGKWLGKLADAVTETAIQDKNPTILRILASAHLGWSEKQQFEHSGQVAVSAGIPERVDETDWSQSADKRTKALQKAGLKLVG